jgi:hypothetical protein
LVFLLLLPCLEFGYSSKAKQEAEEGGLRLVGEEGVFHREFVAMGNHVCLGVNNAHDDRVQSQQEEDVEWELPPIKVVEPDGEIQVFKRPVTVAELIKLHGADDHFVCHSKALITTLTPKAVLPKHQQLEAGRLYYILPNSKLLVQQQEDDNDEDQQPQPNSIFDRKKPMIMQTRGFASSAARESMLLPFEIKLHSKKQQVPGFAQVTVRGQDVATRLVFTAAEDPGLAGRRHDEDEDQLPAAHMISYSTPDLRSMYLMNHAGPSRSSGTSRKNSSCSLTRSNSWKPRLETISEVGAYSRRRIQELVRGRSQKSSNQVHSSSSS